MIYCTTWALTFLQGFGLTSKDALNCLRCAAVKIVRGLFGPLRPSLCLPVLSTTKSSVIPNNARKTEILTVFLYINIGILGNIEVLSVYYILGVHLRHDTAMIKYCVLTLLPILQHFGWRKSLYHKIFLLIIGPADNLACPHHVLIAPCQRSTANSTDKTMQVEHIVQGSHHQVLGRQKLSASSTFDTKSSEKKNYYLVQYKACRKPLLWFMEV